MLDNLQFGNSELEFKAGKICHERFMFAVHFQDPEPSCTSQYRTCRLKRGHYVSSVHVHVHVHNIHVLTVNFDE